MWLADQPETMEAKLASNSAVPCDLIDKLDLKLMCARGVITAIMNTFADDLNSPSLMPPERLHEALFAAEQLVSEAREISAKLPSR